VTAQPGGPTAGFALPGAPADRETFQGWTQWRLSRHGFTPAPPVTLAQWRAMSPRGRQLHDLHRAATHASLAFQETPMSAAVARLLGARITGNALKHKPVTRAGVMISGGGYQGKTETACEVAAAFEDQWLALHGQLNPGAMAGTRDLHAPVAYAQTPVTATPKSICTAILGFYGAPVHYSWTLPQLVRAVRGSLHDHGTRVLILDDITRLRMHREADQDALDLIRSLMSMHVTLVLIGVDIPGSGLLAEGRHRPRGAQPGDSLATQTRRRFDLAELGPFRYGTPAGITAWVTHLAGLEAQVRLLKSRPGMLTAGVMPEYLFRRTSGVVGLLERLIEDGCAAAIATGRENLTTALLDDIDLTVSTAGRDPAAGEVPPVPPRPARRAGKPRSTVFDDHGQP
jgi:Bacterial TniB protein